MSKFDNDNDNRSIYFNIDISITAAYFSLEINLTNLEEEEEQIISVNNPIGYYNYLNFVQLNYNRLPEVFSTG